MSVQEPGFPFFRSSPEESGLDRQLPADSRRLLATSRRLSVNGRR